MYLNPGPKNKSVLFLGGEHRSHNLFFKGRDEDETNMRVFRGGQEFFKNLREGHIIITDNVHRMINGAGFGGLLACGYHQIDRALLQALVERWRPETHTFHLTFGEVTVTLQDVNVLLGLPVDGKPLLEVDHHFSDEVLMGMCQEYLGFTPTIKDFKGKLLRIEKIREHIQGNPLTEEDGDEACTKRARCIILILLGSLLFPDQNNRHAPLYLLVHLIDLTTCAGYSWGGAALAWLYRNLCKAATLVTPNMGGPSQLLEAWAWTRISTVRPTILGDIEPGLPYGARWKNTKSKRNITSHKLGAARTALQALSEKEFEWTPYIGVQLPEVCYSGMGCWMAECYLLYLDVVEYHAPNRVMRQFAFNQKIPRDMPYCQKEHKELHSGNRSGHTYTDWLEHNKKYVHSWTNRHQNVVVGEGTQSLRPGVDEGYESWFNMHTVKYVLNPKVEEGVTRTGFQDYGGRSELMVDGVAHIYQQANTFLDMDTFDHTQHLESLRDNAANMMGMVDHSRNLHYQSFMQTDPVNQMDETVPQTSRRQRRPTRRERGEGTSTNPPRRSIPEEGTSSNPQHADDFVGGNTPFDVDGYRPSFANFSQQFTIQQMASQNTAPQMSYQSPLSPFQPMRSPNVNPQLSPDFATLFRNVPPPQTDMNQWYNYANMPNLGFNRNTFRGDRPPPFNSSPIPYSEMTPLTGPSVEQESQTQTNLGHQQRPRRRTAVVEQPRRVQPVRIRYPRPCGTEQNHKQMRNNQDDDPDEE